jgi:eukaryotic-like serine/threonine-protein kinase
VSRLAIRSEPFRDDTRKLSPVDTTLSDPLVGQVVDGRYRVESRVARGGMATVYLALDRRLDREVALKVMLPDLAEDGEFVGRFVREARAAARLSHPNVVQVFDQGADGDLLYLAMEYLPGRTLRDVLAERQAFTVREALTVIDPVLDALAAAHRAGIVHRDVKPENVILTDDGRVKVADFGLARAMSTAAATTTNGVILGTAAYLAPEVIARGIADARADVYSAGILLFEMLTGKQPFSGSDVATVAQRHVTDVVPVPSTLVPHLLPPVDALVEAATHGDPDLRPANAEQLLALVRSTRQELPESALDIRPRVQVLPGEASGHTVYGHTEVVGERPHPGEPDNLVVNGVLQHPTRAMPMLRRPPDITDLNAPMVHPSMLQPSTLMSTRRRRGRIALVSILVVVALLGVTAWWFTGGPGAYTTTPAVTGRPVGEAVAALRAEGLAADQQPAFDDKVPKGVVISTDPVGNDRVRKGGTVTVVVSQGPQLFTLPKLAGLKQSDAEKVLEKNSLVLGEVSRAYDDKVPSGVVISSNPNPGARLKRAAPVDLKVSKGPHPVQVPNFVGQQQDQAVAALKDLNLKNKIIVQQNEQAPAGQVLSQDPPPGADGRVGDTVTLVVSSGPPMVTVPDVKDKPFDEAVGTLQGLGFQVQRQGTGILNRVISQSPGANSQAPKNSVVVLTTI